MKTVSLGNLIRPSATVRAGAETYPVLSMTMHDGLMDQAARFKKRIASDDLSSYKVIERGQLVVGFPIDEGVLDFQDKYQRAVVSPAYGVWDLSGEPVDRYYLKRFLRSSQALHYYKTKLRGSTARRRSLPAGVFLGLPVPLPPLAEQRRIGAILDQADALRAKRRKVISALDELEQCAFEATCDPSSPKQTLRSLGVRFVSGKNVLASTPSASHDRNRVLRVNSISSGRFIASESKPMPASYTPPEGHAVSRGDILFGRASGSKDLLGAVAVVQQGVQDLFLPDKIWRAELLPHGDLIPEYLIGLLRSVGAKEYIRHNASGAAGVYNIAQSKLLDLIVSTPPLSRQQEFAARVAAINAQRELAERCLATLDEQFASLQSRAFSGQL